MNRAERGDELPTLARLGLPVMLGQLGIMSLHTVDTLMLGQYGVTELAAASLGTQWIFVTLTIGMGIIMGIDPLIAQAHGGKKKDEIALTLHRGLLIALVVSALLGLSWTFTEEVFLALGQEPELCRLAERYTSLQIVSLPPFMLWVALRSYLQGQEIMRPAMWVMLPVNILNLGVNYLFIYSFSWGLDGAAWATAISRLATFALLLAWIYWGRLYENAWYRPRIRQLKDWQGFLPALALGLPIGLQMGLEVSAFSIAATFAGQLGKIELAAHSIVVSISALLFMLPLGLSVGVATRVGNLLGAGKRALLPQTLKAAFQLTGVILFINLSILLLGSTWISRAFSTNTAVVSLATLAFLPCALYQIPDCIQVVLGGTLRGLGKTSAPAVATFCAYYLCGLPLAYYLGIVRSQGIVGIWWGLALALAVLALLMISWVAFLLRGSSVRSP